MRHRKGFNHLGRKSAHRKAMLSNMATSLIMNKRIKTTVAKAKALRGYVEPLITKSKDDTTHSRRVVFSYLQNKESVSELFREIAVKVSSRPGGYTRIIKTGNRLGDNAEMCIIELVDYNELMLAEKEATSKTAKKTRRRGAKKKPSEGQAETTDMVDTAVAEIEKSAEESVEEVSDVIAEVEVKEEPKEEIKDELKAEKKEEKPVAKKEETTKEVKTEKKEAVEVKTEKEVEAKKEVKSKEKEEEKKEDESKESKKDK